jgi:2-haloacid dehalogenase
MSRTNTKPKFKRECSPDTPISTDTKTGSIIMTAFLAFDVYGTLIDTRGVTVALRPLVGNRTSEFVSYWREKQLEYSFRRALMQTYVDFSVCTAQALEFTCRFFHITLGASDRDELLAMYRTLPAYSDVEAGLKALKGLPVRLFAFSNGHPADLESLLQSAGIRHHFEDVISLFEVRTFKPNPAAYAYFHRAAGTGGAETWLISSNSFDVIGAIAAGMKAAWVRRSAEMIFDPWEFEPTVTVSMLGEIARFMDRNTSQRI